MTLVLFSVTIPKAAQELLARPYLSTPSLQEKVLLLAD